MGNSVKGPTKVQVDDIHPSFPHPVSRSPGHRRRSGCSAGPAFHEPTLAGPDPLVVLHMPGECTEGESLP